MRRHAYLLRAALEMGVPLLLAVEAVASTELAHPPGWGDAEVDPETGESVDETEEN